MGYQKILNDHVGLSARKEKSSHELERVRAEFSKCGYLTEHPISVFCAGSLARMEIGENSDLDLFVTADNDEALRSKLNEFTLFANLIQLNQKLGFPPFSNDGEFLKIYFIDDLKALTGSRRDDSENVFTARMLMLLESKALSNRTLFDEHLNDIIEHYYRDCKGKSSFRPLFLLNDILRYWRTLCLNYEERRHDATKPWRKKNINLKFSRLVTVFSTVLPLISRPISSADKMYELCRCTPLERLAFGLDGLGDDGMMSEWSRLLDVYESFLLWKEDADTEKYLSGGSQKETVMEYSEAVSTFMHKALTHERIPAEYRRYLVI